MEQRKLAKFLSKMGSSMNIESRYMEGKARGFKHNPEVFDQLAVQKNQKDEISKLKKSYKSCADTYKKLNECSDKASKDYMFFITEGRQNPKLGTAYNIYADYLTKAADLRSIASNQFTSILEDWKGLNNKDMKAVDSKRDQAEKALVTRQYYEAQKDNSQARDYDSKYATLIHEYVRTLHDLRERKESQIPMYILRSLQAEILLTQALLVNGEMCELALRQLGPVEPIKFDGFRLIEKEAYPMSEDEKKKLSAPTSSPYGNSSSPYGQPTVQTTVVTQQTTYGQPLPTPLPTPVVQQYPQHPRAQGLYPFTATQPEQLSFNVGDILNLLNVDGPWWRAELNGREGMIPSNYVQRI